MFYDAIVKHLNWLNSARKVVVIKVPGGKRNLVKNVMAQQIAFNKIMMKI